MCGEVGDNFKLSPTYDLPYFKNLNYQKVYLMCGEVGDNFKLSPTYDLPYFKNLNYHYSSWALTIGNLHQNSISLLNLLNNLMRQS